MIYKMYSVHDHVGDVFSAPQIHVNDGVAIRGFRLMCQDPNMPFMHSPNDYTFDYIGEFDVDTGDIIGDNVTIIARATDFVRKEKDE